MKTNGLATVFDLFEQASAQGIRLSVNDRDELLVKCAQGKTADRAFIGALKNNKASIIDYLKSSKTRIDSQTLPAGAIEHEGMFYYELAPTQAWWVQEDKQAAFKSRQHATFGFRVDGTFNFDAFKKAVAYVLRRHESLRATFHRIGTQHCMRVEKADAEMFRVQFHDLRNVDASAQLDELVARHHRHQYDVSKGPLFITRLVRTADETCFLCFKMHHVVFDGWSVDILLRDVFQAYQAYARGEEPALPELKFQYRHYMETVNRMAREQGEEDRQYWARCFSNLPQAVDVPGLKSGKEGGKRFAMYGNFVLPAAIPMQWSRQCATSCFIVLQAFFKRYLLHLTGHNDWTISTQVFGRDLLEGSEDQIGVYAKMNVVRTLLDPSKPVSDTIMRVKRSGEDMKNHHSFSLLEMFQSVAPPDKQELIHFSRYMMEYFDASGFYGNAVPRNTDGETDNGLKIEPLPMAYKDESTNAEMKLFFTHQGDEILIRLIYDLDLFTEKAIDGFIGGFIDFVQASGQA